MIEWDIFIDQAAKHIQDRSLTYRGRGIEVARVNGATTGEIDMGFCLLRGMCSFAYLDSNLDVAAIIHGVAIAATIYVV